MIARFFAVLLILPLSAHAETRREMITSFDRVRVQGPFDVRLVIGRGASASIEGDRRVIDRVSVQVNGTTLTVSTATYDRSQPIPAGAGAAMVTLTTPSLRGASVAGGRLSIAGMKGQRIDLTLAGTGSLTVADIQADELVATMLGTGRVSLAGQTQRARLTASGSGAIYAEKLATRDLIARLDGDGSIAAAASATADVANTGLGEITVRGTPSCTIARTAGGSVTCGK